MTTKTSKPSKGDQRGQSSAFTKTGGKAAARAKAKKAGRRGRRSGAMKVGKDRNWGVIIAFVAVGVIAVGIMAFAFWSQRSSARVTWQEEAAGISEIVNYRETNPDMLTNSHVPGPQQYEVSPPVGGNHNGAWQDCQGTVYPEPVHNEHAVHSLEHGAIWITYNPELLAPEQVTQLATLVEGNEKMFMSPFPELDTPISLQAWGYQLKLSDPGDPRISDFIRALRINASLEGQAARCDGLTNTAASDPTSINREG
jgi:Protein of unknown function (DUF3105)